MHRHSASCVIYLTDQTFNFTLPDGTTEPASVPAGALGCGDGNVHLPENIGAAAEFIMVEFKDRGSFEDRLDVHVVSGPGSNGSCAVMGTAAVNAAQQALHPTPRGGGMLTPRGAGERRSLIWPAIPSGERELSNLPVG